MAYCTYDTYSRTAQPDTSLKDSWALEMKYDEALKCLQKRYDMPHLLHQAHVGAIVEVPGLKEGNSKELRLLYDVCSQHLWVLKTIRYDPSWPMVTSLIKMKLDRSTMFGWQRHTQGSSNMPHYVEILKIINFRARASKTVVTKVQNATFSPCPAGSKSGQRMWQTLTQPAYRAV